jgi:hypothetical protein
MAKRATWKEPKSKIVTHTLKDDLLAEIGEELIEAHFANLKGARILYLMKTRENEATDKVVEPRIGEAMGSAKAASMIDLVEAGHWHFRILVSGNWWEKLNAQQRRALLFHQLCHCFMAEGKPRLQGHEFDGFLSELRHFGPWASPLKAAQAALLQQSLEFAEEADGEKPAAEPEREPEPATLGV